jgi:hypothetical protein
VVDHEIYHKASIVQHIVSGLKNVRRVNQIMVRVIIFTVATLHSLQKVLHNQILNLGKTKVNKNQSFTKRLIITLRCLLWIWTASWTFAWARNLDTLTLDSRRLRSYQKLQSSSHSSSSNGKLSHDNCAFIKYLRKLSLPLVLVKPAMVS